MTAARWIVAIYIALCLAALALIPVSANGWFAVAPDPLSAVPAILLGLPWSALLFRASDAGSLAWGFALVGVAMAISAAILSLIGRLATRRWRRLQH